MGKANDVHQVDAVLKPVTSYREARARTEPYPWLRPMMGDIALAPSCIAPRRASACSPRACYNSGCERPGCLTFHPRAKLALKFFPPTTHAALFA
jgi:hypothetical protein